jgi:cell division protein FtsL
VRIGRREQAQARSYEIEYGQLQIEQSTWAMPARIEKIAQRRKTLLNSDSGRQVGLPWDD